MLITSGGYLSQKLGLYQVYSMVASLIGPCTEQQIMHQTRLMPITYNCRNLFSFVPQCSKMRVVISLTSQLHSELTQCNFHCLKPRLHCAISISLKKKTIEFSFMSSCYIRFALVATLPYPRSPLRDAIYNKKKVVLYFTCPASIMLHPKICTKFRFGP